MWHGVKDCLIKATVRSFSYTETVCPAFRIWRTFCAVDWSTIKSSDQVFAWPQFACPTSVQGQFKCVQDTGLLMHISNPNFPGFNTLVIPRTKFYLQVISALIKSKSASKGQSCKATFSIFRHLPNKVNSSIIKSDNHWSFRRYSLQLCQSSNLLQHFALRPSEKNKTVF